MLYLICGTPGSGKTTFAKNLSIEKDATLFTLDEQTNERYGNMHACDWDIREKATKYGLLQNTLKILDKKESVILDYGFFKKEEREWYRSLAKKIDEDVVLYYVTTSYRNQLERVLNRNNEKNNIHIIDKELLDILMKQFEEPVDEVSIIIHT